MNATEEDVTLEEAVVDILKEKKLTVTTVESCTARASGRKTDECAGSFCGI